MFIYDLELKSVSHSCYGDKMRNIVQYIFFSELFEEKVEYKLNKNRFIFFYKKNKKF